MFSRGSSGSAELDRALALAARLWRAGGGEARLGGDALAPVLPMGRLGVWRWRARCQVMGILNATPDSFSDGGALGGSPAGALAAGRALVAAGADVLDVGGQSTRPGAERVSAEEEAARVVPAIAALAADPVTGAVPLSVDTFYASVAEAAVGAGATMVNDVSGGGLDARMHAAVAALGVPYVLMHMRGDPTTMQSAENTAYGDVVAEVAAELRQKAAAAAAVGVETWRLVLDPGLGFAKGGKDNVRLLAGLPRLRAALGPPLRGAPLLVGPSRKGFLGALTGHATPAARDAATAAAAALAAAGGANVVRAHDAAGVRDALRVADAAVAAGGGAPWAPLHER
jgi:2-amino-4-hydroxy-6-hydroxymethyldihydropteridine diphosphokinase/dihydropteroate synthase